MPVNFENNMKELELKLKYGVLSVNEVRQADGLAPAPWGDVPWLPRQWAPTNEPNRSALPEERTGQSAAADEA